MNMGSITNVVTGFVSNASSWIRDNFGPSHKPSGDAKSGGVQAGAALTIDQPVPQSDSSSGSEGNENVKREFALCLFFVFAAWCAKRCPSCFNGFMKPVVDKTKEFLENAARSDVQERKKKEQAMQKQMTAQKQDTDDMLDDIEEERLKSSFA
jgi:hypothetical protein